MKNFLGVSENAMPMFGMEGRDEKQVILFCL